MSFSLSFTGIEAGTIEHKDESGKVTSLETLADRVRAHVKSQLAKQSIEPHLAKPYEAQVEKAVTLALSAVDSLMKDHPPGAAEPKSLTIRLAGHSNWDSSAKGSSLVVEVHAD